ncbi:Cysteine protease atg4 [Entomophthora muscae]|uniref:Cysteine protease atg4 n=1 Tax=Entomophthora muscae TaxID=34485 RepID=A0ACC2U6G2_9FUNG|nr:Cysteine protease atg4 [Entomophthora muscae]
MMELFLDDMSPRCPFSIHRIALLGKQLGNEIGEWFGPNTMAQVLSSLIRDFPELGLRVYVNADGTIYKSSILLPDNNAFKPILILLPIRLGVDSFNPVYHAAIKQYFSFSQIIGIAGGKPSSSFFFMGVEDDEIIYLDPHHSRPAINLKSPVEWAVEDFSSYHCAQPRKLSIGALDPCMLIGFYCSTQEQFLDLCGKIEDQAVGGMPVFRIMDTPPVYKDIDFDLESEEGDFP